LYWTDKHGDKQHRILKREYFPLIGSAGEFKKPFYSLALRNGYGYYEKTILISDGATWIRNLREELFDNVQQILDYFHLCENITNFAKKVFNNDESKYLPWSKNVCYLFKHKSCNNAVQEIKSLGKKMLAKSSFDLLNYIYKNIDSVNYPEYLAKGYFIGSGAIESANRTVLQGRLKLPGMRWNVETAQNVVTLMAKQKSNLWERDVARAVYSHYGICQKSSDSFSIRGS
jgi:hypothetical protein